MTTTTLADRICSCSHDRLIHIYAGRCRRDGCQCAALDEADREPRGNATAAVEARRLVLMVELEQLTLADLVELSDFLNGLLGSSEDPHQTAEFLRAGVEPAPGDVPLDGAVSVRAAYAFGDWPPVLEAVPR